MSRPVGPGIGDAGLETCPVLFGIVRSRVRFSGRAVVTSVPHGVSCRNGSVVSCFSLPPPLSASLSGIPESLRSGGFFGLRILNRMPVPRPKLPPELKSKNFECPVRGRRRSPSVRRMYRKSSVRPIRTELSFYIRRDAGRRSFVFPAELSARGGRSLRFPRDGFFSLQVRGPHGWPHSLQPEAEQPAFFLRSFLYNSQASRATAAHTIIFVTISCMVSRRL